MGKHFNKENDRYDDTNFSGTESNYNLQLLYTQLQNQIVFICSDMLSYIVTLESIYLVNLKKEYGENLENLDLSSIPNPDITTIQSVFLAIYARLNFTQIAVLRYNELFQKYLNGEIEYSLLPNINIIIGNYISLLGYYFTFMGAMGLYERDLTQPIFGV